MDSQDVIHIAEILDERVTIDEDIYEDVIMFFALKTYLTHLTNNGGTLDRIVRVTKMLDSRIGTMKDIFMKIKEG